jgi:hypothetical protein
MKHFFPSFSNWLKMPADPRVKEKIIYPLPFILWTVIMMFMTKLGARRQVNFLFRKREVISNLNALSKTELETMAHDTTLGNLLKRLNPAEISGIITRMVRKLLRMRCLEKFRLLGIYYLIGVDATGQMSFKERHCEHCLVMRKNGIPVYYYHNVLEAKLITSNGMALPVMTEFIENENENVSKQDCELRAFRRLADRLKKSFPQLKICLLMDSLYPGEPVFKICRDNNWKFIITFKEGSMSAFYEEYLFYKRTGRTENACVEKHRLRHDYSWINNMDYKGRHKLNVLECAESEPGEKLADSDPRFVWLTNLGIGENNYKQIAEGGRLRWKIENEGFNMQKNGGYNLEHAYSFDPTALKNLYLLMQIAHLINQLMEKGSLLREHIRKAFGSIRNVARKLLEDLRTKPADSARLKDILSQPIQIRFAPLSHAPP